MRGIHKKYFIPAFREPDYQIEFEYGMERP